MPAVPARSDHPEMGAGSWLWRTAGSRKHSLGTCPVHCNAGSRAHRAGAALGLVGMRVQEKGFSIVKGQINMV